MQDASKPESATDLGHRLAAVNWHLVKAVASVLVRSVAAIPKSQILICNLQPLPSAPRVARPSR
jgi:hypothetical protein